ncbi:MAG: magnesium transporter, partial [Spirochaetes bacterium]|nr:magnesium transporter [Spirochaetota bacterium]
MIANYMHNRQEIFIRRIRRLIQQENFQKLKNVLKKIPPEEIASNLSSFTDEEKYGIFSLLPSGIAGTVLDETDPGSGKYLIKNIEDSQLAKIISRLPDDEAVDILNELDDERSHIILSLVKETENIEKLMTYPPESAGGIMSTDFIVADESNTVRQVLTKIRKFKWKDPELFYVIYITDKDGHLQGTVALPGLLKARPTEIIGKIYKKDPIKVRTYVDQEEAAHIVSLYN